MNDHDGKAEKASSNLDVSTMAANDPELEAIMMKMLPCSPTAAAAGPWSGGDSSFMPCPSPPLQTFAPPPPPTPQPLPLLVVPSSCYPIGNQPQQPQQQQQQKFVLAPVIPPNANQQRLSLKQETLRQKTDREVRERFERQSRKKRKFAATTSSTSTSTSTTNTSTAPPPVPQPLTQTTNHQEIVRKLAAAALKQLEDEHMELRGKQTAEAFLHLLNDPNRNPPCL